MKWLWESKMLTAALGAVAVLATPSSAAASGRLIRHDASWQPDYILYAVGQNITVNCQSRYSTVFNGTSPGPTLHMREGETTWVRVWNRQEDNNATVHWHGLTQRVSPFADGTPSVSQWPIAPNEFFDYEIHPEVGDAGTYFYHSHVGFQGITARGVLIVDEAANRTKPYEYDDDITLSVGDFYAQDDEGVEAGLVANPFKWPGEPTALLLNDRSGNASLGNETADDSCKPYVLTVEPGKTYRLRVIAETALSFFMFGIEGHDELEIIEADGHYTKPAKASYLQLGSGQRYSTLLTTKTEEELAADGKRTYWIKLEARDRPSNPWAWAILEYKTAGNSSCGRDGDEETALPQDLPEDQPVAFPKDPAEYTKWMEYSLEALAPDTDFPRLDEVTRTVYITVNQMVVDGFYNGTIVGGLEWFQNNLTWNEMDHAETNEAPYLVGAYLGTETPDYEAAVANGGWDPATRAWPAKVGEVLDIVWLSNSGPTKGFDHHPMHAHGEHFYDLGSGNGTYDAEANEVHFEDGYVPARRDTTMLYRYSTSSAESFHTAGWRAWRIRVTDDNVGAWMLHCHVLGHMVMGMQTVWVFGEIEDILEEIPQPYVNGYLEYGGSAYGNDTYDPLMMHWYR